MTAEFLRAETLRDVPHGFFTRRGGVSEGPFASLNCSLSGADDPAHVAENRALVAAALDLPPAALVGLFQVHGVAVATVREPWPDSARPQADAVVTDRPGIALGIVTADCGPILFADAEAGVIGACHAGWRGAVAGVAEATVDAMEALGARRDRIAAALGPCIRQPSYEVGRDVWDAVGDPRFFAPGRREAHWQFDMAGLIESRLRAAGLRQVEVLAADTLPDQARFFSHRRRTLAGGGPIGHQISAIALPAS
ncbi:peptidoglycan editing factor PgeF [Roseomonas sp. BN140053]|uniref:peptidoglycan editing factor PgeF n=1 Tax=Roseomonas sp. BN140053 TaxID=3391898 RepID=UPI0039EC363C